MNARISSGQSQSARKTAARCAVIGFALVLIVASALPGLAQDTLYTDPTGLFTATFPAGWKDESTPEYGLFTQSGLSFYLVAVEGSDAQAAISTAVAQVDPDLSTGTQNPQPEFSTVSGTWAEVLYRLPSGKVGIAVGQSNGSATVVLLITADDMNASQGSLGEINAILDSVRIQGVTPLPTSTPIPAAQGEVTFPTLTGPYSVGRIGFGRTDDSRDETFTPDAGDSRFLTVWVWYPAAPAADGQTAAYLTDGMSTIFQKLFGIGASNVHVHAYESAPVHKTDSGYPVLVFSPGNGTNSLLYTALLEEIASHGYVVVGIDHAYNALMAILPDGQVVPGSAVEENDDAYASRIADVEFVIDQLEQVNSSDYLLKGSLDLTHLGIWGHSFGGTTAAGACRADTRCQGVIVIDWRLQGEVAEGGLSQPIMLMDSERISGEQTIQEQLDATGQSVPDEAIATAAAELNRVNAARETTAAMLLDTSSDAYRVVINGSRHYTFSDAPLYANLSPAVGTLVAGISLDPERGLRVASDYVLAFFDAYLKGEPAPLLDGPSSDYPEVIFNRDEN